MIKFSHLISRLFFIAALAKMVNTENAADTNFGNSLLSGKDLKVVMTQVFNNYI